MWRSVWALDTRRHNKNGEDSAPPRPSEGKADNRWSSASDHMKVPTRVLNKRLLRLAVYLATTPRSGEPERERFPPRRSVRGWSETERLRSSRHSCARARPGQAMRGTGQRTSGLCERQGFGGRRVGHWGSFRGLTLAHSMPKKRGIGMPRTITSSIFTPNPRQLRVAHSSRRRSPAEVSARWVQPIPYCCWCSGPAARSLHFTCST